MMFDEPSPEQMDAETLLLAHAISMDKNRYNAALQYLKGQHTLMTGCIQWHNVKRADYEPKPAKKG